MYVTKEIMKKVKEKEKENENFNRCLNMLICPQCGESLKKEALDDPNFIDFKYTCPRCQFTYTRLQS